VRSERAPAAGSELDTGVGLVTDALAGVVSTAEDIQRALAPGARGGIASLVYGTVLAGVLTGGALVRLIARTAGRQAPRAGWLESGAVHRGTGIATGMLGTPPGAPASAGMSVRLDGRRLGLDRDSLAAAYPAASGRLVVFLHGLVETERSWFHRADPARARSGTGFGDRLTEDLPCSAVYVHYDSGRHVSDNGRALVGLLTELAGGWPVPVREIVLIGHSMGGLVARSALHQAGEPAVPWTSAVTRLVCLGTPHTGAPLERGVVRAAGLLGGFPASAPLSRLLAMRSDGIKDLAEGYLHEAQWADPGAGRAVATTLPDGVRQLFVAVTLSRVEGSVWGRLAGDLLVTPASATDLAQGADFRWLGGMHHFDLLHHDDVYDALLGWLRT
jgi:pimeloyl-ACP methyl ester carboxylesterase